MSNEPKWKVMTNGLTVITNGVRQIEVRTGEPAEEICRVLNRLEAEVERLKSDLARCKTEAIAFYDWLHREGYEFGNKAHYAYLGGKHYFILDLINKFRASQPKTNEG